MTNVEAELVKYARRKLELCEKLIAEFPRAPLSDVLAAVETAGVYLDSAMSAEAGPEDVPSIGDQFLAEGSVPWEVDPEPIVKEQ
jgi:hypothetical protein